MSAQQNRRGRPAEARAARGRGAAVVAALTLVLTACASLDGTGGGAPGSGAGGADDGTAGPLLQVVRAGGFVPVGHDFATVPELTVYDDGRAVNHGPQILVFPGPALPNLRSHDLTAEDVDALVEAAREAGLLGEITDYGQPPVADAPTTYLTLTVDGETYVHEAEALGLGEIPPGEGVGAGATDGGTDEGLLPGLTDDQRAARIALSEFIAGAHELVATAGEGEAYPVEALAVMARPSEAADPGTSADTGGDAASSMPAPDELEREVLAWPLDVALADVGECTVVDGADAETLVDALAQANAASRFEQDGVTYDVFFRVLLPHEDGCESLV